MKTISTDIFALKSSEELVFNAAKMIEEVEAGPISDLIQRRICSKLMDCEAEITALRLALEKDTQCSG